MIDIASLDWAKGGGLIPAIVQDRAGAVRMLGYMDRTSLEATMHSGLVTFFSRSKGRMWVKGESSGNYLRVIDIRDDCDRDALLIRADSDGPTCHEGTDSCFGSDGPFFPGGLERVVSERAAADPAQSYTARLASQGMRRIAQKVGEEGVEVALAAAAEESGELICETADLVFHLTLLLNQSGLGWGDVALELERRHRDRTPTASS